MERGGNNGIRERIYTGKNDKVYIYNIFYGNAGVGIGGGWGGGGVESVIKGLSEGDLLVERPGEEVVAFNLVLLSFLPC